MDRPPNNPDNEEPVPEDPDHTEIIEIGISVESSVQRWRRLRRYRYATNQNRNYPLIRLGDDEEAEELVRGEPENFFRVPSPSPRQDREFDVVSLCDSEDDVIQLDDDDEDVDRDVIILENGAEEEVTDEEDDDQLLDFNDFENRPNLRPPSPAGSDATTATYIFEPGQDPLDLEDYDDMEGMEQYDPNFVMGRAEADMLEDDELYLMMLINEGPILRARNINEVVDETQNERNAIQRAENEEYMRMLDEELRMLEEEEEEEEEENEEELPEEFVYKEPVPNYDNPALVLIRVLPKIDVEIMYRRLFPRTWINTLEVFQSDSGEEYYKKAKRNALAIDYRREPEVIGIVQEYINDHQISEVLASADEILGSYVESHRIRNYSLIENSDHHGDEYAMAEAIWTSTLFTDDGRVMFHAGIFASELHA